jgi:hypothetical protein
VVDCDSPFRSLQEKNGFEPFFRFRRRKNQLTSSSLIDRNPFLCRDYEVFVPGVFHLLRHFGILIFAAETG